MIILPHANVTDCKGCGFLKLVKLILPTREIQE